LINDIESLGKRIVDLRSDRESFTVQRNEAFRRLKKAWKNFSRKCRDLYMDMPHHLEGIIPVPSEGFKRRKKKKKDIISASDEHG
jgi:hypothetical protein